MFKFLYYVFGLVAITYEFWSCYNYKTIAALNKKVKETPQDEILLRTTQNEKYFILLQFAYWFWVLVGLFTSQWILFLFVIILGIIHQWLRSQVWNLVDACITIFLIGFAIINTYHLHIPVGKVLMDFFLGE